MKTYAEKLKDPRWQRRRLEILQRDDFTCQFCFNREKELHVHHKKYRKNLNPWESPNEELLTLCKPCHDDVEELKQLIFEDLSDPCLYGTYWNFYQMLHNGYDSIQGIINWLTHKPEAIEPLRKAIYLMIDTSSATTQANPIRSEPERNEP